MKALAGLGALGVMVVVIVACASDSVIERLGDPPASADWRVAVLPAAPVPSEEGGETPTFDYERLEEIRECVTLQLPRETFDVVSLPRVDAVLASNNPAPPDPDEIVRLARQLDARVVILPELFAWDRDYYFLHSVARVGLRVSLFDGETGAPLFRSRREHVRNQGILKIPVGYGGAVYGPIRGILGFQMSFLCDRVSREIAEDLVAYAGSTGGEAPRTASGEKTADDAPQPETAPPLPAR